ncbi:MAG: choline/carnitine O-acyltransferase [Pseudonocardia sp.]|nr:choline/carnitine O-acyltransferase [Pseudonocardia sp.]
MIDKRDESAGTFGREELLPRVPLPGLDESCERFLDWCGPLLTAGELAQTRAAVAEFLAAGGPGRKLHAALEHYDGEPGVHSWLDTFWPYRYLGRRDRIALNANFFFLFRAVRGAGDSGPGAQVDRAARLVAEAVRFKLCLDDESIPPVVLRGQPQTMEQYKYLFSTTRIPGTERDTVRAPYTAERPGPSRARHIVVLVGGRMVRMDVQDHGGRPYPEPVLAAALREVQRAAASASGEPAVGHLTTLARAEWAQRRADLLALDPANATALDTVETALFCLCLDDLAPGDDLAACDALLHGGSGNRWYDKALSLVVFADGAAGINVEHCELDGTTILAFVDAVLGGTCEPPERFAEGRPEFGLVEFVLDDDLRAVTAKAGASFAQFVADTASTLVSFDDFGADTAKRLGVSPDAFVQMAYQLAHRRAKGKLGATYESIATRHWRHGRTEAMRVVTPEALAFVAAMQDPTAGTNARRDAFLAAAAAHVARARQCQRGEAPEQHLWELELIQRRRGAEVGVTEPLALYTSPGWTIMRDDYLSTSSAPSTNIDYFGFGSTSSQCIGVAYVLLPDRFNVYLSTPRPVAEQMTAFAAELRRAIHDLVALLRP